jgi:hypothetical protein
MLFTFRTLFTLRTLFIFRTLFTFRTLFSFGVGWLWIFSQLFEFYSRCAA